MHALRTGRDLEGGVALPSIIGSHGKRHLYGFVMQTIDAVSVALYKAFPPQSIETHT